ncbi:MAG: chromate transporter [Oscillospiraceae bacterium]|nr:chromate transporter [Oscillospiraceae bacterium]
MSAELLHLFTILYTFFKIGLLGFGGGYAMMSMIIAEGEKLNVTMTQMADLSALDLVVPGPIAINSATYVGYLSGGFWGSFIATIGVCLPSFILVLLVMFFINKFRQSNMINGILLGIKPAAVGLIVSAALMLAKDAIIMSEAAFSTVMIGSVGHISILMLVIFLATAILNIKFDVNPILLTVIAGIIGAFVGYK